MIWILMFGFGFISGLRALTPITALSWTARVGRLPLNGSWLAFLGYAWTPWIFSLAAVGELINDKLPGTPSRKTPPQFAVRVLMGAFCGAIVGTPTGLAVVGIFLGALGAIAGTLLGAAMRARLVKAIGGRDLPIALAEDAVAIGLAVLLTQLI
jgi:uncharacterized membrane protein